MDSASDVLRLHAVSRVFPRDVSNISASVLREMFLPSKALGRCPSTHFHALRDVSLTLGVRERAGILGGHRSGKSTLAGIASGQQQATSGQMFARGSRSLIARPGAGFRPGLTVVDNLAFRAMLHGLTGDAMHAVVDRTLSVCGLGRDEAARAMGNLSRFVIRQLGLALLLELPADILVVDEVTGAGTGEARWELRARLQERIQTTTSLVLAADGAFLRDMVERAWVLHAGRLYGPFDVDQAIDVYEQLPEEGSIAADSPFDALRPPRIRAGGASSPAALKAMRDGEEEDVAEAEDDDTSDVRSLKRGGAPWRALGISVDGEDFRHSRLSLIRPPRSVMRISLEMVSQVDQEFSGGLFLLHGGDSGAEVGKAPYARATIPVEAGGRASLSFELVAPDWGESFYGLTFCPQTAGKYFIPSHRLKVVIFGPGYRNDHPPARSLEIRNSRFERKARDGNLDTLPQGQQAAGEVGGQIQAPAEAGR